MMRGVRRLDLYMYLNQVNLDRSFKGTTRCPPSRNRWQQNGRWICWHLWMARRIHRLDLYKFFVCIFLTVQILLSSTSYNCCEQGYAKIWARLVWAKPAELRTCLGQPKILFCLIFYSNFYVVSNVCSLKYSNQNHTSHYYYSVLRVKRSSQSQNKYRRWQFFQNHEFNL